MVNKSLSPGILWILNIEYEPGSNCCKCLELWNPSSDLSTDENYSFYVIFYQ